MNSIEVYEDRLKNLQFIWPYLPDDKNNLTILAMLNKQYDENTISDYLAYVLDPEKNGLGLKPLNNLISLFDEEKVIETEDYNYIEIFREYGFKDGSRIDLLIKVNDSFVIAIESKVLAKESKNQTNNYSQHIKSEFGDDNILIFLSIGGQETISDFKSLSYKKLVSQLKDVNFDLTKDIRKSVYYQDFIIHLEEYIMADGNAKLTEKSKLYIEYKDMLEDLRSSLLKDSKKTFEQVENYIKNHFDDNWTIKFKSKRYQQISKEPWRSLDYLDVHFEYHFSPENILFRDKIKYMVDAEGNNRNKFIKIFNEICQEKINEFRDKNIKCCPPDKKRSIVYKEYRNNPEKLIETISKSLSEFEFLIDLIDKAFEKYLEGDNDAR